MDENIRRNVKRWSALAAALVLALVIFNWFYAHAYLNVTVDNPTAGKTITYQLINQASQKTTAVRTTAATIKKRVLKGSYEVYVSQSETSYFKLARTGAFLSTSSVSGRLAPEKSRSFVGNNPGPCMYYDGSLLFSYGCGGGFSELQVHQPATADTPTITQNSTTPLNYTIEGLINVHGSAQVLLQNTAGGPEDDHQLLYVVDSNLSVIGGQALDDLGDGTYNLLRYKEGAIVSSSDLGSIYYYQDFSAKPAAITIQKPAGGSLYPLGLSAQGGLIAAIYSTTSPDENTEQGPNFVSSGRTVTEIFDPATSKTREFSFDGAATSAKLCGQHYICLLNGKTLGVYDISGGRAKKQFEVGSVKYIENDSNAFLAVTDKGVLGLDIDARAGSLQYSFGGYKFCALQKVDSGGYVLCLINNKNNKVALFVDPKTTNSDSIDKKVLKLLANPNINDVSAYKNYLYLSPNLGVSIFNSASGGYEYDPALVKLTNSNISALINQLGIDPARYTIINPYR